jgi:hypothetical protein
MNSRRAATCRRWCEPDDGDCAVSTKAIDPTSLINEPLYIGEKCLLLGTELFPEPEQDLMRLAAPPASLARPSQGMDQRLPCGPPAGSGFVNHSGLLTEVCLLGNVAVRCQGTKLLWDGPNLKVTNHPAASHLVRYRPG